MFGTVFAEREREREKERIALFPQRDNFVYINGFGGDLLLKPFLFVLSLFFIHF
jgi:hypothetical protein